MKLSNKLIGGSNAIHTEPVTRPVLTPLAWVVMGIVFCVCLSLISYNNGVRDERLRITGGGR